MPFLHIGEQQTSFNIRCATSMAPGFPNRVMSSTIVRRSNCTMAKRIRRPPVGVSASPSSDSSLFVDVPIDSGFVPSSAQRKLQLLRNSNRGRVFRMNEGSDSIQLKHLRIAEPNVRGFDVGFQERP